MHSGEGAEPAWKTKPSWYLVAQEDRMINPATQLFLARRMGAQTRSEKIDHAPLVTAPELVVQMILEAVTSVAARPNSRSPICGSVVELTAVPSDKYEQEKR